MFHAGKVVVTVLPPVHVEGKSLDEMDDLITETREKMIKCFEETSIIKINASSWLI